jgi:HlyD family secretion protein
MRGLPRFFAALLVLAALIACGAWLFTRRTNAPVETFQTTAVGRGDLVARISATGTLEPEEVVDVGAQVAGQILSFGKDQQGKAIDYGSAVKAGTVLARIDDSLYALDVAQAQATLAVGEPRWCRARPRSSRRRPR